MGRVKFLGGRSIGAIRIALNPADGEHVTIGPVPAVGGVTGKRYEFDNNAAVTAGNIPVTIGGSAAASAIALRNAINANKPTPVGVTATLDPIDPLTIRLQADAPGAAGNLALAETMAGAGNEVSGAVMTGGENGGNQTLHRGEYVVTAIDVAAGNILIHTGLQGPRFLQIDVIDTADKPKYITSITKFDGPNIQIDFDGATNPAAGDKVSWGAYE